MVDASETAVQPPGADTRDELFQGVDDYLADVVRQAEHHRRLVAALRDRHDVRELLQSSAAQLAGLEEKLVSARHATSRFEKFLADQDKATKPPKELEELAGVCRGTCTEVIASAQFLDIGIEAVMGREPSAAILLQLDTQMVKLRDSIVNTLKFAQKINAGNL